MLAVLTVSWAPTIHIENNCLIKLDIEN